VGKLLFILLRTSPERLVAIFTGYIMSRKNIKLSDVRRAAALRCTWKEVATFCEVSTTTLAKLRKEDPRIDEAYDNGLCEANISLRRNQQVLSQSNAPMSIHLGKQYLDQTDKKTIEHTGPDGSSLEFNISALSKEERTQLKKIVEKSTGTDQS
jgi:hypothetical protein